MSNDNFKGSNTIVLQPGDQNVPYSFVFNAASGTTANDGSIPYGSTVVSSTILAHYGDDSSINASTMIVGSVALSSNIVIVYMQHSTQLSRDGLYHLTIKPTISLFGSTLQMIRQYDFNRVIVRNQ